MSLHLSLVEGAIEEGEIFDRVFLVKDGGSGDYEVGFHCCNLRNSGFVDTTVDANEEFGFPLEEGFDFGGDVIEKELFSRVGADAEEKNVVDLIEVVFDETGGGSGVEGNAAEDIFVCGNTGEGIIDVSSVFDGEGDEVCSGFCE